MTQSGEPLLVMQRISKRFGATQALADVSFSVRGGEVMALVGENGAGKSTLMKILSGAHRPDAGEIRVAGRKFTPGSPQQARDAGVAMIYQELNLAPDLSVEDNIMLGREASRFGCLLRGRQRPRVEEALDLLGHGELRPDAPVRSLSVGAQQLVEIARALVHDAKVIVFDEPTSSLTGHDVEHLFAVIRRLRATGRAIVYISHFLDEVRQLCDRYTVLRDGRVAGAGSLAGVTEPEIVALMVGRSVEELFPTVPHTPGDVLLLIDGLCGNRFPVDAGVEIRRGEIFGVFGLVGAGRTELLRCIFGLDAVKSGRVRVADVPLAPTPRAAIAKGLGFVSEDRKGEGLAQDRSIADNLTYSRLRPYSTLGWLRLGQRRAAVQDWMTRLQVKAQSPEQEIASLSGGNQQKVAIARVLHQDAHVLLLDEPTRGIDVATKADIYRLIGQLAAEGRSVIFVSSYCHELLAVCDRIAVMSRGRVTAVRAVNDWNDKSIMAAAIDVEDKPAAHSTAHSATVDANTSAESGG
ncbi:MAG: sugar ABC transporter ATP-binding protein [Pirellulales bacterium]